MSKNTIKVAIGNDLPLCKKLTTIMAGQVTPIPAEQITNLKVLFGMGNISKAEELQVTKVSGSAIIHFRLESTQLNKIGQYNIWITGKYGTNDVSVNYGAVIEVIEWSQKSNIGEYIYNDEQALDDSVFIPAASTDAEIEALKAQLAEAIEDAEEAKEDYEEAKEDADTAAYNAAHNLTSSAIQSAVTTGINNSGAAKESTIGTSSDTSSNQTVFGKIAGVFSALTSWINGQWTTFYTAWTSLLTDYARRTDLSGLATEANATANRTALTNAIAALKGNNADANLTAIYTIVGAITSGLTDADKTWLQQQFNAIDLSSVTSRLDNSTYGLNALKTAISSITFDTSSLAKEATLGNPNDTASANTIFGKIANLLSTWNTWISGAWATLVSNVGAVKTETDKIGTNATGQAATLFGALAQVSPAQVEAGVTRIQQRLGVADSYTADVIPTATAESKAQEHLRAVHGAVSGEQSTTNYKLYGVVRVKHAATDTDSNSELASLNRNLVYGGATKDKSWQSGGQVVTTKVPDTGYGFTEFWLKNGDSWIHYTSSLPSQQDNINTLHPALHTTITDQQGNIVRTPTHIIVLTNPE